MFLQLIYFLKGIRTKLLTLVVQKRIHSLEASVLLMDWNPTPSDFKNLPTLCFARCDIMVIFFSLGFSFP